LEGNLRRGAPGKRPKVGAPAGRKEIEEGVLGKTHHLPPLDTNRTERSRSGCDSGSCSRRPSRARRLQGVGGTERGGRGQLVPVLTSRWDGLWREIDGGGRTAGRGGTDAAVGTRGEGGVAGRCASSWRVT
jgi:hypothetical protein